MITKNNTPMQIDRNAAVELLRTACHEVAHQDYAQKYTENEEDLRACLYHRIRNGLDADECWRVFLSYSTLRSNSDTTLRKPDLVFLRGQPVHRNLSLEILVEIKNWPTVEQVRQDLWKLVEIRKRFPEKPHLVFFGIGPGLQHSTPDLEAKFQGEQGLDILLYDHDRIYQGPWIKEEQTDPYRKKLRELPGVSGENETEEIRAGM